MAQLYIGVALSLDQRGDRPRGATQKNICGADVYQHRVEYQGAGQSGSLLPQPRLNSDQKAERKTPAGRQGRVHQNGNQPPATKQSIYGALYINLALSSGVNCYAEGYGFNHASRALKKLNAKALLDDTSVSTRAVYQP